MIASSRKLEHTVWSNPTFRRDHRDLHGGTGTNHLRLCHLSVRPRQGWPRYDTRFLFLHMNSKTPHRNFSIGSLRSACYPVGIKVGWPKGYCRGTVAVVKVDPRQDVYVVSSTMQRAIQ